uniref:Uncharacterized protein n=1 Tax=Steinernema glaseri TaxID=37863 RepID=A0A1I8ADA9_9BILA
MSTNLSKHPCSGLHVHTVVYNLLPYSGVRLVKENGDPHFIIIPYFCRTQQSFTLFPCQMAMVAQPSITQPVLITVGDRRLSTRSPGRRALCGDIKRRQQRRRQKERIMFAYRINSSDRSPGAAPKNNRKSVDVNSASLSNAANF